MAFKKEGGFRKASVFYQVIKTRHGKTQANGILRQEEGVWQKAGAHRKQFW